MKCLYCGTDNLQQAHFCHRCGVPLAAAPGQLAVGTVLQNRYQIQGILGLGGMGNVYLAQHLALGDQLAVKEMREDLLDPADRPHAVAQFQATACTLARLRHPNLPRVLDYFSENGHWYLVMDYVQGQTLAELQAAARGGSLPETQVLAWTAQLCDVLEYLHGQNPPVIFRDLKPDNVMVNADGQVKLIDFGIARLFDPTKGTDTLKMGTVGYAPPEQHVGQGQTSPRSDLYALGATLHQLLTGADPTTTPFAFDPPCTLNPRVSPPVSAAVMKALNLDPADRFASVAGMKRALLQKRRVITSWQDVAIAALAVGVAIMILTLAGVVGYRLLGGTLGPETTMATTEVAILAATATTEIATLATTVATEVTTLATTLPTGQPTQTTVPPLLATTALPEATGAPRAPTSTPLPTSTELPGATPQPTGTPRPGSTPSPPPSPTSPPAPGHPLAPILLNPASGVALHGAWKFEWQWPHSALAEGQAFDLLIWSEAEDQEHQGKRARGVIELTQETWAVVDLDLVEAIDGHEGTYYWTVIVVQKQPYKRIGEWGEKRVLVYKTPGGPPSPKKTKEPPTDPPGPEPTDTKPPPSP